MRLRLFALVILIAGSTLSLHAAIPAQQRDALAKLYASTNGTSWADHTNWMGDSGTECQWYGIYCDENDANVTGISLDSNNLSGSLPPEIGSFPALQWLSVTQNDLSGALPSQIGNLTNLEYLDLNENRFSGAVPAEVGRLTKLVHIAAYSNGLTSLPHELGDLPLLTDVIFDTNALSGPVPDFLTRMPQLTIIALGNNAFTGGIPPGIWNLTKLQTLSLWGNQLGGPIPEQLGNLTELTDFDLSGNHFSGPIPQSIGNLTKLQYFALSQNQFTGQIPETVGNMRALQHFYVNENQLSGPLPASIGQLAALQEIYLSLNAFTGTLDQLGNLTELAMLLADDNQFSGTIPPSFANLQKLETVSISSNQLSGEIPPAFAAIRTLRYVSLNWNRFSGTIPTEFASLPQLDTLNLDGNDLAGTIPPGFENIPTLLVLSLGFNQLEGTIPAALGSSHTITQLSLAGNKFSGAIPPQLGGMSGLHYLDLSSNALTGAIPRELMSLPLDDAVNDFRYNALYTTDSSLRDFINRKQYEGTWEDFQTLAPSELKVLGAKEHALVVGWKRVAYIYDAGGYEFSVATTPDGAPVRIVTTPDKELSAFEIDGLAPSTTYYVRMRAVTFPHDPQQNTLLSEYTPSVSGRTSQDVIAPPLVVVETFPYGMVAEPNKPGAEDGYLLKNVGDQQTTVTIGQEGSFFIQDPNQPFTLDPGEERYVFLASVAEPAGAYHGASTLSGAGVPAGLKIGVDLLVASPNGGDAKAEADENRVDIAAPANEQPTGTVTFTNVGTSPLVGILVANEPWIVPPQGIVTIQPGETKDITFGIDRTKRPDAGDLSGAETGTLTLLYLAGTNAGALQRDGALATNANSTPVTIIDTVRPSVTQTGIQPLAANEIALLVPGVGHVTGGVGLFISDVAITNAFGAARVSDLKVNYVPATGYSTTPSSAPVNALSPSQAVNLADVVKNVFNTDQQVGTILVRSASIANLTVNANIFNVSNSQGTYGTSIPVFRSDRSLAPGEKLYLTGLRKDATIRTNVFVQETTGHPASFSVDFLDTSGTRLGGASDAVEPFKIYRILDKAPAGTVSAVVTNATTSLGRIDAYATPVDQASGDFWSISDWTRLLNYRPDEPVIIPVAGAQHGANLTFFRTDASIMNTGTTFANVSIRYYDIFGATSQKLVTVKPNETKSIDDIIGSLFTPSGDSVGFVVIDGQNAKLVVSSRTYATVSNRPGTYGAGTPTLALSSSLHTGQSHVISGLEISSTKTVIAQKAATFRTNIGMVETLGAPATVKVTVLFADSRSAVYGPITTLTFDLQPHQFFFVSNLADRLASVSRGTDLHNVQLDFQVTGGGGAVSVFTSSVDNGTGDTLLRIE